MGVRVITVDTQGDHHSKWKDSPEQTWLVAAASGFAQAIRLLGRAGGAQDVPGLLLSVPACTDFIREPFTDSGALAIPWKGRDVGKHFRPALSGRDEPEAAIVVPFRERAVYAHKYSSLAPLIRLVR